MKHLPASGAPRPRLLAAAAAAVAGALALATVVTARPARADTVGDVQAQAAALAQRIATEQNQVDQLSEQYDGARYHLAQVQAQVAGADAALARASANAARLHTRVVHELVQAYVSGGFDQPGALPVGGTDPVVAESYLSVATGGQRDLLDRLQASRRSLADRQAQLDAARQHAAAALQTLADARSAVEAAQAQTTATLASVKGHLAVLVAQQQAAQRAAASRPPALPPPAASGQGPVAPPPSASPSGLLPSPPAAPARPPLVAAPPVASPPATAASPPPTAPPRTSAPTTAPPAPSPAPAAPPAPTHAAAVAVQVALAQVGKPYVFGTAGPDSFDCSGLVQYAYGAAGVYLPHYTVAQWDDTVHIPLGALEPGDLIFFYSDFHHVGIYLGGGMMVDAPHTGASVRVESVNWFGPVVGASRVA